MALNQSLLHFKVGFFFRKSQNNSALHVKSNEIAQAATLEAALGHFLLQGRVHRHLGKGHLLCLNTTAVSQRLRGLMLCI